MSQGVRSPFNHINCDAEHLLVFNSGCFRFTSGPDEIGKWRLCLFGGLF